MKGKIITIEGGDGTGKKTQAEMLVARLRKEGHSVETMSFPRYNTPTGKVIRAYLDGKLGNLNEVSGKVASGFYAADRLAAQGQIKQWLGEGKIIVLDRYVESNIGHQASKVAEHEREETIKWVYGFEVSDLGILPSDIVVLLTLPLDLADEAVIVRGEAKDIHEQDQNYLREVHKTYEQAAKLFGWQIVSCMSSEENKRLTKEEVAEKVWEIVSSKISTT